MPAGEILTLPHLLPGDRKVVCSQHACNTRLAYLGVPVVPETSLKFELAIVHGLVAAIVQDWQLSTMTGENGNRPAGKPQCKGKSSKVYLGKINVKHRAVRS